MLDDPLVRTELCTTVVIMELLDDVPAESRLGTLVAKLDDPLQETELDTSGVIIIGTLYELINIIPGLSALGAFVILLDDPPEKTEFGASAVIVMESLLEDDTTFGEFVANLVDMPEGTSVESALGALVKMLDASLE